MLSRAIPRRRLSSVIAPISLACQTKDLADALPLAGASLSAAVAIESVSSDIRFPSSSSHNFGNFDLIAAAADRTSFSPITAELIATALIPLAITSSTFDRLIPAIATAGIGKLAATICPARSKPGRKSRGFVELRKIGPTPI
jgi:hypothetical protein